MAFHQEEIAEIESKLGICFTSRQLLEDVFTHPSYYHEHRAQTSGHYERLEFLGDAVLGMIMSEYLFNLFPDVPEGKLSLFKSRLVNSVACARFAERLAIVRFVRLGKSHKQLSDTSRQNILANLFEALLGAIFLQGGFVRVKEFFWERFQADVDAILNNPEVNWKAKLQELVQQRYKLLPSYELAEVSGPAHEPIFAIRVMIAGEPLGEGIHRTRQGAEQQAAEKAYRIIQEGTWHPSKSE